ICNYSIPSFSRSPLTDTPLTRRISLSPLSVSKQRNLRQLKSTTVAASRTVAAANTSSSIDRFTVFFNFRFNWVRLLIYIQRSPIFASPSPLYSLIHYFFGVSEEQENMQKEVLSKAWPKERGKVPMGKENATPMIKESEEKILKKVILATCYEICNSICWCMYPCYLEFNLLLLRVGCAGVGVLLRASYAGVAAAR
ncbi:hypothetical protein Dimus_037538, partial [Dionaea muscipula]